MFSKRLTQLRKYHNFTQRELCSKLGISQGALAKYERGIRRPDFETLCSIADFFNVTTDYLLGQTDHFGVRIVKPEEL